LTSVVIVRGRRGVGFGDREARFVGKEKVPVTSEKQRAIKRVGEGKGSIVLHSNGNLSGLGGGKVLVMYIPGDRGGVRKGRETEAEGATRDGLGVIDMKVSKEDGRGFSDENGDTSSIGVKGERGEEVEGVVDGAKGK
jgi:hypothetical protein